MKKLLLTLLLLTPAIPALAQDSIPSLRNYQLRRHEVRITVGAYPARPMNYMTDYDMVMKNPGQQFEDTKQYRGSTLTAGTYSVAYAYRFRKWVDFGVAVSYSNEYYKTYSNLDGSILKRHNTSFVSIIPTVRFTWLNREWVRLYSSCGMGITLVGGDYDSFRSRQKFAGQFTPIGIAIGRSLFGFVEVGVGTQGALMAGIGYSFNSKKAQR